MNRKTISIILALSLILSLIPAMGITALATEPVCKIISEGTLKDQSFGSVIGAVQAAGTTETTIQLIADSSENNCVGIAANQNITIDLNGHILRCTSSNTIYNAGTLIITDTSEDKYNYFYYTTSDCWGNIYTEFDESTAINLSDITDETADNTIIKLKGGAVSGQSQRGGIVNYGTLSISNINIVGNGVSAIYSEGELIADNCNVVGNYYPYTNYYYYYNGYYSGGVNNYGKCTITDCFFGYNIGYDGGGIYARTQVEEYTNLTRVTLKGNKAYFGGGVYNYAEWDGTVGEYKKDSGMLNITDCIITDNDASGYYYGSNDYDSSYGGGIYNWGGKMTVSGGEISYNNTAYYGGGIYSNTDKNNDITIDSVDIINNTAYEGGGVYIAPYNTNNGGKTTITDCSISENNASYLYNEVEYGYGGGLYNNGCELTVTDCEINKNTAANWGGGICSYTYSERELILDGSTSVTYNEAQYAGGIYHTTGKLTADGVEISNNTATYSGGGIYNNNGKITVSGGDISDNTAGYCGGGIYTYTNADGALSLEDGTVVKENTAQYGGGIYNSAYWNSSTSSYISNTGILNITDSTVTGNEATGAIYDEELDSAGGGIYNYLGKMTVSGGEISYNNAASVGGGIYTTSDENTENSLSNVTVKENYAQYGGGIVNDSQWDSANEEYLDNTGLLTLDSCTITENEGLFGGGINNSGELTLNDCTVTDNTITATEGVYKEDFGGAGINFCGGSLELSGKTEIFDNLMNGEQNNLYMAFDDSGEEFADNTPVIIGEDGLTADSLIGISHYMTATAETPIQVTAESEETYKSRFKSDEAEYVVVFTEEEGTKGEEGYVPAHLELVPSVCGIEGNGYLTLQDAVYAAKKGDTIVLFGDNSESVTVNEAKTFTIDEDGHSFTGTVTAADGYSVTENNRTYTVKRQSKLAGLIADFIGTVLGCETVDYYPLGELIVVCIKHFIRAFL